MNITENKVYNAFITTVEIKPTCRDAQVKMTLQVLTDGRPTTITDVVYLSPNYTKKINAIYTALGLERPTEDAFKTDTKNKFACWLNRPFQLNFKKNKEGYIQPYIYLAPNSTVAEKWNARGFGEKEGKVHEPFMATAQLDAVTASQLRQVGVLA